MLTPLPASKCLLNYRPLSIEKNIKGFLSAKKHYKIFGVLFEGNFDNQIQTIIDSKISQIKNNWQKHEHIHCKVKKQKNPAKNLILFEAFYFFPFENPIPFRERVYLFFSNILSTRQSIIFQMEILQAYNNYSFEFKNSSSKLGKFFQNLSETEKILNQCSIFWVLNSTNVDKEKKDFFFAGELINGGCTIFSFIKFKFLQVKDNLILSENSLWVNDRGFDEEGTLEYGNSMKIPYKLDRISNLNQLTCTKRKIKKKYK